jgi:replicative DNA helicase
MASDVRFTTEIGIQIPMTAYEDDWARLLAGWICDYVRVYNVSPIDNLVRFVRERARTIQDEDTRDSVVSFARNVVTYHEGHKELFSNSKYIRDTVLAWVKERNLTVLMTNLQNALDEGNTLRAEEALNKYSAVKQLEFTSVNMLHDANKIIDAYEEERGELFQFPEALGEMVGPLARGDLMLLLGESGTGKSWLSLQLGMDAVKEGLSVLYLNLENAESQMIRRIYSNMQGRPKTISDCMLPYFESTGVDYIDDDATKGKQSWRVAYRKTRLEPPSTKREDVEAFMKRMRMTTNGGRFLLETYAPNTLTCRDLEHLLDNYRDYRNFIPDVLIVDYVDLLRPENMKDDKRNRIDSLCLGLRRIALDRDILVVTPQQSNRNGFGRDVTKANVAENIGNVAHAAIILGLNHTEEEKERGITRIKILKNRDGHEYSRYAYCVGCLDIGRPVMHSRWSDTVEGFDRNERDDDDE